MDRKNGGDAVADVMHGRVMHVVAVIVVVVPVIVVVIGVDMDQSRRR